MLTGQTTVKYRTAGTLMPTGKTAVQYRTAGTL